MLVEAEYVYEDFMQTGYLFLKSFISCLLSIYLNERSKCHETFRKTL